MNKSWFGLFSLLALFLVMTPLAAFSQKNGDSKQTTTAPTVRPKQLTLRQCIDLALKNNRKHTISKLQIQVAEAQHRQALSSFWPQLTFQSALIRMDKDPVFLYPKESATYEVSGFIRPMKLTVDIPPKYVKQMDRVNFSSNLGLMYPLFTGGLRTALSKQTRAGIQIAKAGLRKTDLELERDVKKYYYGAILATRLYQIARNAQDRLEVLLTLTKNMYEKGSGKVKKTDYLQIKSIVDNARALVAQFDANREMALAALGNLLNLPWDTPIELAEKEIPYTLANLNLKELISSSYKFNPDWAKLNAALQIYEGKIKEARSHYFPQLALTGTLMHVENKYHAGIVSPRNRTLWVVGLGMQFPLFSGFRTRNQVQEARVQLQKLKESQILLRQGLALQVKYYFLKLEEIQRQERFLREALKTATANRDLNERAYKEDMAKMQDVMSAQIFASLSEAQYEKIRYEAAVAQANLTYVVGKEVRKWSQKEGIG